jgi:N-acyl-D-amino-acid deacylase
MRVQATLLEGGQVVDGSGSPAWTGDVLLVGERVACLGANLRSQLPSLLPDGLTIVDMGVVDCRDRVVSPGFIDVHTHDDAVVLDHPDMLPKLSQGITTVVVGNCGISLVPMVALKAQAPLSLLGQAQFRFATLAAYAQAVDAAVPGVNVAALLGHTALRMRHVPNLEQAATADEIAAMAQDLSEAMQDGALGLSSGVFYREAFAADPTELTALARVAAAGGGVYATHIRDEMDGILEAMREAAQTAQRGGLPLILSHHKCAGPANWGRTIETLALVDTLAKTQALALDVYPYTAGSTVLREDLVDGVIDVLITRSDSFPAMGGRYLADIAKEWDLSQQEACKRLMPGGACYFQMREDDVERVIAHPLSMIGSDGLPHDERPHPRLWGAFPKVLACYWREKGTLKLEQAIHKMTGLSARNLHIEGRGLLQPNAWADVVVFDPKRVADKATYQHPNRFSEGIEAVWVNGVLSYTGTQRATGQRAGRFVKRGARPDPDAPGP